MTKLSVADAVAILISQNDYYKALDISAQITRLNALDKLSKDPWNASHCDANPNHIDELTWLVNKSKERLFSSITLLCELEKKVNYDAIDDIISSIQDQSRGGAL